MAHSDKLTATDPLTVTSDDIPDSHTPTVTSKQTTVYANNPALGPPDDQQAVSTRVDCHFVTDEDVSAVIAQLRTDKAPIPPSVSTNDLYQAAATVGVPVWIPDAKERFIDKLCDQFDHEWNADTCNSASVDDEDVSAVIERLCTDESPIPQPFSKTELYQTAAAVGIPVWHPDVTESLTNELCAQLNYQWHADTFEFIPRVGTDVTTRLNAASDAIYAALNTTDNSHALNAEITNWCEQNGLLEATDEPKRVFAQHAALALLAKATLYEDHHRHGGFQSLESSSSSALPQPEIPLDDVPFEESLLDTVVQLLSEDELKSLFDARYRVLWTAHPAEALGWLYETVLPDDTRKLFGQYRTPSDVATIMYRWATRDAHTVLDPGLGNGALSTPPTHRWTGTQDPNRVVGIDRSPLACLFGHTALRLALQPHTPLTENFLTAPPDDIAGDIDAVVCNPPYTRARQIECRDQINDRLSAATGRDIPKTSPLYAYFFYRLETFLDAGDRAAVLIPQRFLSANYGTTLKQYLLDEYNIRALALFDPDESIYENANITSVITFLEACDGDSRGQTTVFEIDDTPSPTDFLSVLRDGTDDTDDLEWGVCKDIQQSELSAEQDWQSLFVNSQFESSGLPRLSEIADIKRGISTGENDFFCLSEAERQDEGIDEQYLAPLVRRSAQIDGYDIQQCDWMDYREQDDEAWLLYNVAGISGVPSDLDGTDQTSVGRADAPSSSTSNVVDYLYWGMTEHDTLSSRSVLQSRECWYRVGRREPASILISSMSRSRFRAIWNKAGVRHLNNLYGIYPSGDFDETERKALLGYLNSDLADAFLTQSGHRLESGVDKIEPGDLGDIPVLDPRTVSDATVERLAEAFDELRAGVRTAEPTDDISSRINDIIQEAIPRLQ